MPLPMGNGTPTPGWSNDVSPEVVGVVFGVTGIGLITYGVLKFRNKNTDNFEVALILRHPLFAMIVGTICIVLSVAAQFRSSPIYECLITFVTAPDQLLELLSGFLFLPCSRGDKNQPALKVVKSSSFSLLIERGWDTDNLNLNYCLLNN